MAKIIDKANKDREFIKRNRITQLEHHIDKCHSELRAAMGFCVKVMDNNPFETDFHALQNDASYLHEKLEGLLDEYIDTGSDS